MKIVTVIPCYRELAERVALSVESAHVGGLVDEVVVVTDGGWEGRELVVEAARAAGARVLAKGSNGGCAAALNVAIAELAADTIVCRLDVGDLFFTDPKERQLAALAGGEAIASASPWFDPVAGADRRPPASWAQRIYSDGVFAASTTVFRQHAWAAVGGFDESLRWGDDWDFAIKVQHRFGHLMHPEVTCSAGQFPGGVSDTGGDPRRAAARRAACEVVRQRAQDLRRPRPAYFDKRRKVWT